VGQDRKTPSSIHLSMRSKKRYLFHGCQADHQHYHPPVFSTITGGI
jgi:hypothetical protein